MFVNIRRFRLAAAVCPFLVLATAGGCGFATGGVVAATSGGGGSSNAPPTSTDFVVLNPKLSPADIEIELTDADADAVDVEFTYEVGGAGERLLTRIPQNPVRLAASREGVRHRLSWDFAAEPGIGTAALTKNVTLRARISAGTTRSILIPFLGNDAPTVTPEQPIAGEVSGVVPLSFLVVDSSADITAIQVEWQVVGESVWHLARAAGLSADERTAAFSLGSVEATAAGTRRLFFWDSAYVGTPGDLDFEPQLPGLERDVTFRFTAQDTVATGAPRELGPIRVDNNAAPIVQINDGALSAGGDRRRTVALPFTVFDQESDTVDVVFQWKAASEAQFQDLGTTDPVVLRQLLQDESFARTKRICKGSRTSLYGSGVLLDGLHFRTSDFAGQHVSALARGIVGSTIDFLRPAAAAPTVVSTSWANNHLVHPVDVLAIEDGLEILVLDDLGGAGRLSVVEVATGAMRVVAGSVPGVPDVMAWLPSRRGVVVASHGSTGWLLHEVLLATGQATQRAVATPMTGVQSIRDLVAYSESVVFATVANKVLRIDWLEPSTPRVSPLLDNLQEPWGLLFDPHDPQRVFVAERTFAVPGLGTFGRVAAWDLRVRLPVAFLPVAQAPRRPTRLDLDPSGRRLCVLSETVSGGRELRRYELGNGADGVFPAVPLGAGATAVTASVLGSWLAVDGAARTLTVQGGIVERRSVTGYELATGIVTLDVPVVLAGPGLTWRLQPPSGQSLTAAPQGTRGSFLWDTRDVAGAGLVNVRAIAIDSEFGQFTAPSSSISMSLDDVIDVTPDPLGSTISVVADLDADGRVDVKSGDRVFRQIAPRTFSAALEPITNASFVLDVNGDGRNDLIETGAQVRIYQALESGTFPPTPTLTIALPADLVADFDGDGRFDLVRLGQDVRYQTAPLTWSAAIPLPGDLPADVNADGWIDVARKLGANVEIFLQRASGQMPSVPDAVVVTDGFSQTLGATGATSLCDVDRDGLVDVVTQVLQNFPTRTQILFQARDGTFGVDILVAGGGGGFLGKAIDLDADGLVDLVGSSLVRQCQAGLFLEAPLQLGGSPASDIDGDGALDFVTGGRVGFGRGEPNFRAQHVTGLSGSAHVLADFDLDGLMDLAVGKSEAAPGSPFGASAARIFLQREGDVFSSQASQAVTSASGGDDLDTPRLLDAGDVNLDGATDYLLQSLSNQLSFYSFAVASLTGVLQTSGPLLAQTLFAPMLSADIIDDIRPELLRGVNLELHMGTQTFGPWPTGGPGCIAVGDLNADGRRDIVVGLVGGASNGILRLLLQNQDGSFPALGDERTTGTSQVTKALVADVDGDGVTDIVALVGGVVGVLYGPSHAAFSGVAPGVVTQDFVLFDCDEDGDLDLLCTTGALTLIRQLAPRAFAVSFSVGQAAQSLSARDVDNDGVIDVAVSDSANGVRILYGGR